MSTTDLTTAHYTQIIACNPSKAEAYYERGRLYENGGNYERALADYSEANRLAPKTAPFSIGEAVSTGKSRNTS